MRATVLIALLAGCGCVHYDWLSAHGPASICADSIGLTEEAAAAVAYWNDAGDTGLRPCAQGSIVVHLDPYPINPGENYLAWTSPPWKDGGPDISVEPTVIEWARDQDPQMRSKAARVLAHELGHAMSLIHNQDPASVMFPDAGSQLPASASDIDQALARSLVN